METVSITGLMSVTKVQKVSDLYQSHFGQQKTEQK
jgi:hypothetical protein